MQTPNKKEKPPLQRAARMVYDATETAYHYERDRHYIPTAEELELFGVLEHSLYECHHAVRQIHGHMAQRAAGKRKP